MAEDSGLVRELFDLHWQRTVRLAGLLRAADAEDVAAESFVRLLTHQHRLHAADQALSYLRRIVLNIVRDQARHARWADQRMQVLARSASLAVSSGTSAAQDQRILDAVACLPGRQREAIVLRFWLDLRQHEIAQAMSVSIGSVKTHLARGLAALRPALEASDDQ